MSLHLLPCPDCVRHIRASEPACPFCGREIPESLRTSAPPRAPARRLGRGALLAFGVATSIGVAACSDRDGDEDAGGSDSGGMMMADSGGGGVDSGGGDVDSGGGDVDSGSGDVDSGTPTRDSGTDSGGTMALYGAPADPDSGRPMRDDAGGAMALYGAPADPDDPA